MFETIHVPFRLTVNFITCHRHFSSAPIKRFYKNVSIVNNDEAFEVLLDSRKIKTPLNNVLKVNSISLAHLIASEWRSQKKLVKRHEMLLTQLAFTAIDNPMNLTKEEMINQLVEWTTTDTLCFRIQEPNEVKILQEKNYNPIFDWLKDKYECEIPTSNNILPPDIPDITKKKLQRIFNFNQPSLFGLLSIAENLKSVILSLALINRKITVSKAVDLSRLELEYQTRVWGNVEWAHDIDKNLTTANVASALLFFFANCESTKVVQKSK